VSDSLAGTLARPEGVWAGPSGVVLDEAALRKLDAERLGPR
jgi:hypothetical protein